MPKHHTLGGSTTSRWMNCPGSVAAIAEAKEQGLIPKEEKESPYAREGTIAHELGEECLRKGFDPIDFYGNKFQSTIMTDDYVDAVEVYVNFVRKKINTYSRKYGAANVKLLVEEKFDLTKHLGYDSGGSADAIIAVRGGPLDVIDYKHGRGVLVEVDGNTQARFYGYGAWRKLNKEFGFKRTINTIVQPRARHPDGPIRSEKLAGKSIVRWGKRDLIPAVEAVRSKNPSLVAGEKQCQWCPVAPICPENAKRQTELTQMEFEDFIDGEGEFPNPKNLSILQLEQIVSQKKALEHWLKQVYEHLHSMAQLGTPLECNKIVATYSNRAITDESEAIKLLKKKGVKKANLFVEPKLKTPAQIESHLKHDLEWDKSKIDKVMGKIVIRRETGSAVVPMDDRREALPPPAQSDFAKTAKKPKKPKNSRKSKNGKIKKVKRKTS